MRRSGGILPIWRHRAGRDAAPGGAVAVQGQSDSEAYQQVRAARKTRPRSARWRALPCAMWRTAMSCAGFRHGGGISGPCLAQAARAPHGGHKLIAHRQRGGAEGRLYADPDRRRIPRGRGSFVTEAGAPILSQISIHTFFLTTCGLSVEKGITYQRTDEAPGAKRMMGVPTARSPLPTAPSSASTR